MIPTEQSAQEQREKYILAFNDTMIQIWQERITLLDVIDTGALLSSPLALPVQADGRFFEVTLSQAFLEYGLWQDYGVGRETPKGNSGDLSRANRTNGVPESQLTFGERSNCGDFNEQRSFSVASKLRRRRPWFSRKYYASVLNLRDFLGDNIGKEFQGIIADTFARTNKIY